ncbi:hypothetical protein CCY16_00485 [Wolbachia endosymbiont of Wuchereria bancrofti]|nr:hypothetical protein CCY16_00485 [Wolbachia endosymbiont of Wuchereria bancrofti]
MTKISSQKGVDLAKSKKDISKFETASSNQKKEWEADSKKKAEEIERLKTLKKKSDEELQEAIRKLAGQERSVKHLGSRMKKARDVAVSSIAAHTEALHENLI